jgi:transcriptional regulator with XRE-family HTH domain
MALTEKEKRERARFLIRLGEHIRSKREEKKITAAELARLCYMDKPNLLRIEKGRTNPSAFILKRIADGLEISFSELLEGFE